MRESVVFFINGDRHEVYGREALMTVSDYLRYERGLPGTKVVCAEGDCGACTVLLSKLRGNTMEPYRSINSCIAQVYSLHRSHLITVEGLKKGGDLHPVQKSMVDKQGSQCGYCTPGFVCSLAVMAEDAKREGFSIDEKRVRNYTTGNLCRCTGYAPILEAGSDLDPASIPSLSTLFSDDGIRDQLLAIPSASIRIRDGSRELFMPLTLEEAVAERERVPSLRIASGSTDLGVVVNKGKLKLDQVMTLHEVESLQAVIENADRFTIGARASLHSVEWALRNQFPDFSRMLRIFASPQIKNSGTLVGNLMNASPIADTIPFLRVAEAVIVLVSVRGERRVGINDFILPGYKKMAIEPGELVRAIEIPKTSHRFKLYKVSSRKDLDISAVTFAARYELKGGVFQEFKLALGGVGPSVLRMGDLEKRVMGQVLSSELFADLSESLRNEVSPLSDVRGSADYRRQLVRNLMLRFYDELALEAGLKGLEASV